MQSIYKYEKKQINCVSCAVGFGEPLKKRKAEEGVPEAPPSPQPPLIPTEHADQPEAEAQEMGHAETSKPKKRVKTAARKKTAQAETPFEPLVPEMQITISAVEDA